MQRYRRGVIAHDPGHDRVEAAGLGTVDEFGEQGSAHAGPSVVAAHVDGVLDGGGVGGSGSIGRKCSETDDLAIELGHHRGHRPGTGLEPRLLLGKGTGNEIECDRGSLDLDVVDPTYSLGIIGAGQTQVHDAHRIARERPGRAELGTPRRSWHDDEPVLATSVVDAPP